MGQIKSYKELKVSQKAHELALLTIELVESFSLKKSLDLIGTQLLRSATSIGANIAEGCGSFSGEEYSRYLKIALKSAYETQKWLDLLNDSKLLAREINVSLLAEIQKQNTEVIKMLVTLINKLEKKSGA